MESFDKASKFSIVRLINALYRIVAISTAFILSGFVP